MFHIWYVVPAYYMPPTCILYNYANIYCKIAYLKGWTNVERKCWARVLQKLAYDIVIKINTADIYKRAPNFRPFCSPSDGYRDKYFGPMVQNGQFWLNRRQPANILQNGTNFIWRLGNHMYIDTTKSRNRRFCGFGRSLRTTLENQFFIFGLICKKNEKIGQRKKKRRSKPMTHHRSRDEEGCAKNEEVIKLFKKIRIRRSSRRRSRRRSSRLRVGNNTHFIKHTPFGECLIRI